MGRVTQLFLSAFGAIRRVESRVGKAAGIGLVVAGLLILIGAVSYYAYSQYARSGLDELNASFEGPFSLPAEAVSAGFTPVEPDTPRPAGPVNGASYLAPTVAPLSPPAQAPAPARRENAALPASAFISTYPGVQMHPKYWDRPLWAGTDLRQDTSLPQGYSQASAADTPASAGALGTATRIRIPAIDVDSAVSELRILDLGDSRAYETPKNVVGHIPETANPGETGNGWFFGHLESPIRGEGNVFKNLPRIPEHLNNGDPVYITISNEDGEFLYQVFSTKVVYKDDLSLYDSGDSSIVLVACVPRLVYDHRILVNARLVGIKN